MTMSSSFISCSKKTSVVRPTGRLFRLHKIHSTLTKTDFIDLSADADDETDQTYTKDSLTFQFDKYDPHPAESIPEVDRILKNRK